MRDDALYVRGEVRDEEVEWLLDTGCSLSLISVDVWRRIPSEKRPMLQENPTSMTTADGSRLPDF